MAKARAIAVIVVLAVLFSVISAVPVMATPGTPDNVSPAPNATDVSLTPVLQASIMSGGIGSHFASQWQIRDVAGGFSSPVFDSGIDDANLEGIDIPVG